MALTTGPEPAGTCQGLHGVQVGEDARIIDRAGDGQHTEHAEGAATHRQGTVGLRPGAGGDLGPQQCLIGGQILNDASPRQAAGLGLGILRAGQRDDYATLVATEPPGPAPRCLGLELALVQDACEGEVPGWQFGGQRELGRHVVNPRQPAQGDAADVILRHGLAVQVGGVVVLHPS